VKQFCQRRKRGGGEGVKNLHGGKTKKMEKRKVNGTSKKGIVERKEERWYRIFQTKTEALGPDNDKRITN